MSRISWTTAQTKPDESVAVRRARNRISGMFLGLGAMALFAALILIPGLDVAHRTTLTVMFTVIIAAAVVQVVTAATVPIVMNHATSVLSAAAIATVQILVGDPTAIAVVGFLYIMVAVLTAVFYSMRAALIHLGVLIAAQIVVLGYLKDATLLPQTLVVVFCCASLTFMVSLLTRELRQQVIADALTGLLNRRGFHPAFASMLAVAERRHEPLAVAALDLDGFKAINDTRGHSVGDQVLVDCADAWRRVLRPGDVLARIGGDEFVLLMPGCDPAAARQVVGRLQDVTPHNLTMSVGLRIASGHEDPDDLLRQADAAMYRAKRAVGHHLVIDDGDGLEPR